MEGVGGFGNDDDSLAHGDRFSVDRVGPVHMHSTIDGVVFCARAPLPIDRLRVSARISLFRVFGTLVYGIILLRFGKSTRSRMRAVSRPPVPPVGSRVARCLHSTTLYKAPYTVIHRYTCTWVWGTPRSAHPCPGAQIIHVSDTHSSPDLTASRHVSSAGYNACSRARAGRALTNLTPPHSLCPAISSWLSLSFGYLFPRLSLSAISSRSYLFRLSLPGYLCPAISNIPSSARLLASANQVRRRLALPLARLVGSLPRRAALALAPKAPNVGRHGQLRAQLHAPPPPHVRVEVVLDPVGFAPWQVLDDLRPLGADRLDEPQDELVLLGRPVALLNPGASRVVRG